MRHITYLIERLPTLPFRPRQPFRHPHGQGQGQAQTQGQGSNFQTSNCLMRFGKGKFLAALLSTQLQQFHLQ